MRAQALAVFAVAGVVAVGAATMSDQKKPAEPKASAKSAEPEKKPPKSKTVSQQERVDALARAAVWSAPAPIARAQLGPDPRQPKEISCTFEITQLGGTAPKFDCRTDGGERLRVKYGRTPEVPSEVAAAKLLHTLGFGADNVILV